jgi:hypothetical protein
MVIHGFRNQQNVPAKNYNCNAKERTAKPQSLKKKRSGHRNLNWITLGQGPTTLCAKN